MLLSLTLSIIIPASLSAQTSTYEPKGAAELYTLARNILSPIELNNLGLIDLPADPASTQFQLRRACLYLEAATEFDPTNPLVWRDLADLYISDTINDPNRAEIAVSNYIRLKPQDNLPVNSLLDYYLGSFNDLDSRQGYLLEYVHDPQKNAFIQNYPHIYSQILTELGKYAWEQGLEDDPNASPIDPTGLQEPPVYGARTYFNQAIRVSPYNDRALALLLTLPTQDVTDPNLIATHELNQALRWRIRLLNNPHDLNATFELINTLEQLGKADLAQEYTAHARFLQNTEPNLPRPVGTETPQTQVDLITQTFRNEFTDNDLKMSRAPEKAVYFTLKMDSDIFNYGDHIIAQLQLINISGNNNIPTEFALGPGNFIDPHVVITAELKTSSDINNGFAETYDNSANPPMMLAYRYLLQKPILMPGESNSTTEALNISTLRQILQSHPQQEFTITFRAYIDPVIDENNKISGSIPSIQSAAVTVVRKAFVPSPSRLKAIMSTIHNGTAQENINATRLLAGLVHEAELARRGQLDYRVQQLNVADLRNIIFQNLGHTDASVRGWSVYALHQFTLTPDSTVFNRLSEIISRSDGADWFARFMGVEVLDPIAELNEYLPWAYSIETNPLLRRQILLYQHLPWRD